MLAHARRKATATARVVASVCDRVEARQPRQEAVPACVSIPADGSTASRPCDAAAAVQVVAPLCNSTVTSQRGEAAAAHIGIPANGSVAASQPRIRTASPPATAGSRVPGRTRAEGARRSASTNMLLHSAWAERSLSRCWRCCEPPGRTVDRRCWLGMCRQNARAHPAHGKGVKQLGYKAWSSAEAARAQPSKQLAPVASVDTTRSEPCSVAAGTGAGVSC